MSFVWMVECKTCQQRFAVLRRELVAGKSTDAIVAGQEAGSFECPHCHDLHSYWSDELIPGEGRLQGS